MKACPFCAEEIQDAAVVCKHCGSQEAADTHDWLPPGAVTPWSQPPARINGLAIASMVLGIVWIYGLGAALALIFGYRARRQIQASGGAESGGGMATAGIVLGWVGLAGAVVVIALIAWTYPFADPTITADLEYVPVPA